MTLLQAIAITVISCLAILVPAAPGYWGLLEAGFVFGMVVLGVEKDQSRAMAWALVVHSLQYFPILALTFWYLHRDHIRVADLKQGQASA